MAPAAAAALKNWEAQARTNSILAGALKALEERLDAVAELPAWSQVRSRGEEAAQRGCVCAGARRSRRAPSRASAVDRGPKKCKEQLELMGFIARAGFTRGIHVECVGRAQGGGCWGGRGALNAPAPCQPASRTALPFWTWRAPRPCRAWHICKGFDFGPVAAAIGHKG